MGRRTIAFEDDALDQEASLDTDAQIGDETASDPAADADAALPADQLEGEADAHADIDPDAPIELPDLDDLKIFELERKEASQQRREEHKEVIEAIQQDGAIVLTKMNDALEHFRQACLTKSSGKLQLASESLDQAQEIAGVGAIEHVPYPPAEQTLEQADLDTAMEGFSTTISNILKAIMAAIKKAMMYLKDFFKDIWRQMRSLEEAIKKRGEQIADVRKRNVKLLDRNAKQVGVDYDNYVDLGGKKRYLLVAGERPTPAEKADYSERFRDLTGLMATARAYDEFIRSFDDGAASFLNALEQSVDGLLDRSEIDQIFKDVASLDAMHVKAAYDVADLVDENHHSDDQIELEVSPDFIGNFKQIFAVPNGKFLAGNPTVLENLAITRIDYSEEAALGVQNGMMPFLELWTIERASKVIAEQAQLLITMQRIGDMCVYELDEQLAVRLKKADSLVVQNSKESAEVAAAKNQHLITLTRAAGALTGFTNNFFTQVTSHVRNVQYAWLSYLTETLKRDIAVLNGIKAQAAPAAQGKELQVS